MNEVKCLDAGYVRLVDSMGGDLRVVNSAKASFKKSSTEIGPNEIGLIKFLGEHGHTSCFRNNIVTFEIKMPLMIFMQLQKYFVGSNHTFDNLNAASGRYITMDKEFYVPDQTQWRGIPANRKQGSAAPLDNPIMRDCLLEQDIPVSEMLQEYVAQGLMNYESAIAAGVCVEQARLFLPAYALYTVAYWTCSLQTLTHVLNQRVKTDAQREWGDYTRAFYNLTHHLWPLSMDALLEPEVKKLLENSSTTTSTSSASS